MTEINSFLILLLFVGVVAISILLFKAWILLVPNKYILFGISIILVGFLGSYFFWLYIIGYGLNKLFPKYGSDKGFKKYKIVLFTACITILIGYIGSIIYLKELGKQPPEFVTLPLGLLSLYCFIHIIGHLTNDFKSLDKGTEPIFWDYIVTMFLISFFPFGLMIMHSHMRLLKKDKIKEDQLKIIEKTNANTTE